MAPVRGVEVHTMGDKYVDSVVFRYRDGKRTQKGQEGSGGKTEKFVLREGEYITSIKVIQDKGEANALLYGIQFITNTGRETHGRAGQCSWDSDIKTRDVFEVGHANATQFLGSNPPGKETKEFRAKPGYAIIGIKVKSNFYLKMVDITQGKRSQNTALEVVDLGAVVTPKQLQIYQTDFARFDADKSGAIEEKECKALAAFQYGKKLTKDQWKAWMDTMDLNSDGKITIDEYLDGALGRGWSVLSVEPDTFSVDFEAEWHGKGGNKGAIYKLRFKMRAGEEGCSLWGADGGSADAQRQAEDVITARGGAAVGDEVAVFGLVQWEPMIKPAHGLPNGWSCESEGIVKNCDVELDDGTKIELRQNIDAASRKAMRGVEHLCGWYSPSTSRLSVAGTHLGEDNSGEARLESYDLFVTHSGHGASGACKGAAPGGQWEHRIGFGTENSGETKDSTNAVPLTLEEKIAALGKNAGIFAIGCTRSCESMAGKQTLEQLLDHSGGTSANYVLPLR